MGHVRGVRFLTRIEASHIQTGWPFQSLSGLPQQKNAQGAEHHHVHQLWQEEEGDVTTQDQEQLMSHKHDELWKQMVLFMFVMPVEEKSELQETERR